MSMTCTGLRGEKKAIKDQLRTCTNNYIIRINGRQKEEQNDAFRIKNRLGSL